MQDFEWHRCLRGDRESVKDEECSGRPLTSCKAKSIEKFSAVHSTHHLQVRLFQSIDKVKSASLSELEHMAKNGFQKCFDELYRRWQKCAAA
ncbi:hypothetical protein TNCV_3856061 [Trichonephila clavipes]|nr:hypothetical protein TNCV_3856061 [Trichonephila clavipes]